MTALLHFYEICKDEITKEEKYFNFATYIINTDGVGKGNMIEEAKANNDPWLFPVKKAYESILQILNNSLVI